MELRETPKTSPTAFIKLSTDSVDVPPPSLVIVASIYLTDPAMMSELSVEVKRA